MDHQGNLYVSGPGGLWIIFAQGKHLGTILARKHLHNMAWGGDEVIRPTNGAAKLASQH